MWKDSPHLSHYFTGFRFSTSPNSDWINNLKNRDSSCKLRNAHFYLSISRIFRIRIWATEASREPDQMPDRHYYQRKNTSPGTPLKGKYNSLHFARFLIFATNRRDNVHGGQKRLIFVSTTGSSGGNKPVQAPDG